MHLLMLYFHKGIFFSGLIYIWSSGEYLGQQDGVVGIEST